MIDVYLVMAGLLGTVQTEWPRQVPTIAEVSFLGGSDFWPKAKNCDTEI